MTRRTRVSSRPTIVEADRVADGTAERDLELVGDPLGHGARGKSRRGWVWAIGAAHPTPELEADLGQLGRLARPGLAGHHDDLMVADRGEQVVVPCGDRQLRRIGDRRHRRAPALHPRLRLGELLRKARAPLRVVRAQASAAAAQALLVLQHQLAERGVVDSGHGE